MSAPAAVRCEEHELGFLALAGSPERAPGVVLVHDVWGLADHPRDLARRLAREGFHVLAVDLYRRERGDGPIAIRDPSAWMRAMSDTRVLADLEEAARFLLARPEVLGAGAGVVGFCMGGMYALLAACACEGFAAAVPFYGLLSHTEGLLAGASSALKPIAPLDAARSLRCPLLGFFGEDDEFVSVDDVHALERRLAKNALPSEIVIVPGAGHAFMNDTRPDAFRAEAAAAAWGRMVAFLHAQLG